MRSIPSGAPRQRVRPALRWLAIVSVILLTPFTAHAVWDYVELRRLTREIQAIQAKGEPVTQVQAGRGYRKLTADQAQGSRYYLAAAALGGDSYDNREVIRPWHEWMAGGTKTAPDRNAMTRQLADIVKSNEEALVLVDLGNTHSFNGFSAGTDYSYRAAQMANLSVVLAARTLHLSFMRRGDEAVQSALSALQFRRAVRDAGWFVLGNHEIPSVLSLASASADSLASLQAALEAEEKTFSLEKEFATERATHIDVIWRRYYGTDPTAPHLRSLPMRSFAETVWRPWFTHSFVSTLRKWTELMEASRKPWPEKTKAVAEVFRKHPTDEKPPRFPLLSPKGLMGAAFWAPVGGATFTTTLGSSTFITDRCTRVAIALERFRRDHDAKLPGSLNDLVPRYLEGVPMDPADGSPLRFAQDATAYTVYSIGADGQDNGGDLSSELRTVIEKGWGRRYIRGRDQGVRVLLGSASLP